MIKIFILLLLFKSSCWAAATGIKVVRNSKEIVTINLTPQDHTEIILCQQSSVELNFLDENGEPTPLAGINFDKELDPVLGYIQKYPDRHSFLILSALSYKTFNQYVKQNVDLTDFLRIKKMDKTSYIIKVQLMFCPSNITKVKVINFKSKLNNIADSEDAENEFVEDIIPLEENIVSKKMDEAKADEIITKIAEIEKTNTVRFEITETQPVFNQEEIDAMKEAEKINIETKSKEKKQYLLDMINKNSK